MAQSFLDYQLSFPRVQAAYDEKGKYIEDLFRSKNLQYPPDSIFLRAFKWNKKLEIWVFDKEKNKFYLLNSYNICSLSGDLGPKRREGDMQMPEGFYTINVFNPNSKYHLSLGVSYPNESDKIIGFQEALGGDIYIHGACETIGCFPMTDAMIKEIYLICVLAKSNGQQEIPIHIFPTRLTTPNLQKAISLFPKRNVLHNFWKQLKVGFDYFELHRKLPLMKVDAGGNYILEKE